MAQLRKKPATEGRRDRAAVLKREKYGEEGSLENEDGKRNACLGAERGVGDPGRSADGKGVFLKAENQG